MIDPKDIFHAHRVVKAPGLYRPTALRPPLLPAQVPLRGARRRVVVRSVRRAAAEQVAAATSLVRRIGIRPK